MMADDERLFQQLARARRWMRKLQKRAPMKAYQIKRGARRHVATETGCSLAELESALADSRHPRRREVLRAFLDYLDRARQRHDAWI